MKRYKIETGDACSPAPYGVYRRHVLIFWKHVRSYSSESKAMSAIKMFELNDKKKGK